jgi:F420-non-reducing hydrogenase small subunit
MSKLKLAIYWAAGCGGCDVSVLDLNERILKVAEIFDLVLWPIAADFKYADVEAYPDASIDVCLLNGAICSAENEHLAKLLRKKSKVLVAYGACAHIGGIPGLANFYPHADVVKQVYTTSVSTPNREGTIPAEHTACPFGDLTLPKLFGRVRTLDQVVKVDYYLPGCPPVVDQAWGAINALLAPKKPPLGAVVGASEVTLCEECKRTKAEKRIKEFKSIATFQPDPEQCLLEQGIVCAGPATRAGCGSRCVNANVPCRGCYGPPGGVADQGAKLLSAVASVVDSEDPVEIARILAGVDDPAGTFYRFSLPSSLLRGAQHKETA